MYCMVFVLQNATMFANLRKKSHLIFWIPTFFAWHLFYIDIPVFHLMPCVRGKFHCCVIVDSVINGLVGHLYPLVYTQISWYLSWRPLAVGDVFLDSPDQFVGVFGVLYRSLSSLHSHIVRLCPDIFSRWRAAYDFTWKCCLTDADNVNNFFSCCFLLE